MGKDSKSCKQPSHQLLKSQAKNRVEDLQSMLNALQVARQESRGVDVVTLEEQVNQVLREWKAELDEPSPASSLLEETLSFSKLLREYVEVEDDATSPLMVPSVSRNGDATSELAGVHSVGNGEAHFVNHISQQQSFQDFQNTTQQHKFSGTHLPDNSTPNHNLLGSDSHTPHSLDYFGFEQCNSGTDGRNITNFGAQDLHNIMANNFGIPHLDFHLENEIYLSSSGVEHWEIDDVSDFSGILPNFNPPPCAFLGPKCALWDCARPAQGSEFCKDYCSDFHATLAVQECPPGTSPILRPGGIDLKDGPLFAALKLKLEGKEVGIPECLGAATSKSPWKTPELFDISILEGEKIREWLFFDKPRRAFETGTRKQRSLPDHEGRGWHESRKLVMKEYGGQKRCYYADPQPHKDLEWHLFEYELNNCTFCALYRLELKVTEEKKKSPKTKVTNDPLLDLQKRMGRLTAEVSAESKRSGKGKAKFSEKSEQGNDILISRENDVHGSGGLAETHIANNSQECG